MDSEENIYVVMVERNLNDSCLADNPDFMVRRMLVETHEDNFNLQSAHALGRRWVGHGEIKIGRVIFSDLDQIVTTRVTNDLLLPDNIKLDDLIGMLHEVASESGGGLPIEDNAVVAQMRLEILKWIRNL